MYVNKTTSVEPVRNKGRFHLYSDTSKFTMGSVLDQNQNDNPKLIAHVSKRLQEAARNYSITELEMCGLVMNIAGFVHLFKRVELDAIVDHSALTDINKSKAELTTTRIKKIIRGIKFLLI